MSVKQSVNVNSPKAILSIALLAAIAPAAVVLGPILVGAYVTNLGFTAQQAGYLIASELVGAGLATFIAYFSVSRLNWHTILRVSLLICLLGNLGSAFLQEHLMLVYVRFLVGLAFGTIMTMTIVIVGMTDDQERNFGFWSMGQVIFAVIGFAIFPSLMPVFGVSGFFIFMAVVMALLQLTVTSLPSAGNTEHQMGLQSLPPMAKKLAPVGLVALFFFYIGIGSVWAYVERIGAQANFDPQFIGNVLSGSSIVGVMGASLATWMSTKFGRLMPAVLGYAMIGVPIAMYYGTPGALIYILASLAFKFGWWFISPYLLANMTSLDPSGRIAILTNFVIGVGLGFGPAIAAWLLGDDTSVPQSELNYEPVIYLGVGCVVVSLLLLYPIIKHNNGLEVPEKGAD